MTCLLPAGRRVATERWTGPRGCARPASGFTLLELMIVVAVIAILTTMAYPAYMDRATKTHRVAAESCLAEYANYMERYYTTNLRYDKVPPSGPANTLPLLDCSKQTGDSYSYQLTSLALATYKVQAVPVGSQATRDAKCGTLALDQAGTRSVTGTSTVDDCW